MINWTWQDTFDLTTIILLTDYCCTALYLAIPQAQIINTIMINSNVNSKVEVREHMMSFKCLPHSCQISTFPFSKGRTTLSANYLETL